MQGPHRASAEDDRAACGTRSTDGSGAGHAGSLAIHSSRLRGTPQVDHCSDRRRTMTSGLILKRGDPSRRRDNDYDVLEDGKVVGRIFHLEAAAPEGRPWMWASGHSADSVK